MLSVPSLFLPPPSSSGSVHLSSSLCGVWFVRADDEFVYEWRELISPEWSLSLSVSLLSLVSFFLYFFLDQPRQSKKAPPPPPPFRSYQPCKMPCPSEFQICVYVCWRGHGPFQDTKEYTYNWFPILGFFECFYMSPILSTFKMFCRYFLFIGIFFLLQKIPHQNWQ